MNKPKIVAVMPIKLNNERCPGKNTRMLGDKPLLQYELNSLKQTALCDSINVYCSDEAVVPFLPDGIHFIKRSPVLDLPSSNFTQIFNCFMAEQDADIYVYAHATAPFITVETMIECIEAVKSKEYDSAFCAVKLQDYLWQNGIPLNFDASNIPRTQDLNPIYQETSGVYVFAKSVFEKYKRRIGIKPFIKEVTFKEAIDIDTPKDFSLAEVMLNVIL
ncbi:MAG: acylneuraminate cytidylyltransferase [Bacteroidales bacterium]|nr:acylneuraminate cytidylyltransferase [Bacteroidales bacterium]